MGPGSMFHLPSSRKIDFSLPWNLELGTWNYNMVLSDDPPSSSHMKNGPPNRAVITPTGISAGAMIVRARVSHNVRNIPPKRIVAGVR